MIKCRNCNTESQPGNIYCLNCGRELNTKILKVPSPKPFSPYKIFCRILILSILCIAGYITYSIIYPSIFSPKLPTLSRTELTNSKERLRDLEFIKNKSFTFSAKEITVLYNEYLISSNLKQNPLFITVDDDGNLCFKIHVQFHSQLHLLTPITITGSPAFKFINNQRTIASLHIEKMSLGKVPVPKSLYKYLTPYFTDYYNDRSRNLLKKVFDIKIKKNKSITFILHRKKYFPY